MSGKEIPKTE
jgi:leukotriene-A4 hydrolase